MSALLSLLILAATTTPDTQVRDSDAVEVFSCDFGRQWDVNYDDWPDKWQRVSGPGLPHYVGIAVEEDASAASGRCLTVRSNGGGAAVQSPNTAVSGTFSYVLEARLRLRHIEHGRARVCIDFCDGSHKILQTASSVWCSGTQDWTDVRVGPINLLDDRIRTAQVSLRLEAGARPDLKGEVALGNLWLGRVPKMTVRANSPFNVYSSKDDIEIICKLSGIVDSEPHVHFELLDADSKSLDRHQVRLKGQLVADRQASTADNSDGAGEQPAPDAAYSGSVSWRPPIRKHGFYTVLVTMRTSGGLTKQERINVALVPPLVHAQHGEFGWSLAGDDLPMSLDDLATFLPRLAINWVKLPVWYAENDSARGDQIVVLAERLAANDIEVVGVLDQPPTGSPLAAQLSADAVISDTFATDSSAWLPLLDPVLTRLSLRVRWWQLGCDDDVSFSTVPHLENELAKIREKLFRFGQDVELGIGWKWYQDADDSRRASWDFQQFSASPALTGDELGEYLEAPGRKRVDRWVLIEPLPRSNYDLQTRACDLIAQMLAAKIHGADAIFAAHPFDNERGLMTDAGEPGELLLPWRTAASVLSGARYLGSMKLPRGSSNELFETPAGDVVMVVWNDQPTKEAIHMGGDVSVLDAWGREEQPAQQDNRQVIEVGLLPKFVRGVFLQIMRWRLATTLADGHMSSVFGKSHPNKLHFQNMFPQGVSGAVELIPPRDWQVQPSRLDFKLAPGETMQQPFELMLPSDASSGNAPIRADFIVDADRQYRFSVYLDVAVGDKDIEIETSTRLDDDGSLVVEQRMINRSDSLVDFKCLLYPGAGRRRQRTQVFQLGASQDLKTYRFPNGADLLGTTMWLKAEEVNGKRVINHRFVAEQ